MNRVLLTVSLCLLTLSCGVARAEDSAKPTALLVGGEGAFATLTDEQMATVLHGYFADYTRVNVPFPGDGNAFAYSISEGAKNLLAAVDATSGRITIGGASEGAPAVLEVLRELASDPNAPPPDQLNAIVYGNPGPLFYFFGPPYRPLPVTQYDLTVVKAEYDGIADAPDNLLNLLADVNAVMGAEQLHTSAAFTSDLSQVPAQDITVVKNAKGGTTTTYVVPTAVLPLLQPLLDKGMPASEVATLDKILRPIIDSAYIRTWTGHQIVQASAAATTTSAPTTASAVTAESSPAVQSAAAPTSSAGAVKVIATKTPAPQGKRQRQATGSTVGKAQTNSPGNKGAARARR